MLHVSFFGIEGLWNRLPFLHDIRELQLRPLVSREALLLAVRIQALPAAAHLIAPTHRTGIQDLGIAVFAERAAHDLLASAPAPWPEAG